MQRERPECESWVELRVQASRFIYPKKEKCMVGIEKATHAITNHFNLSTHFLSKVFNCPLKCSFVSQPLDAAQLSLLRQRILQEDMQSLERTQYLQSLKKTRMYALLLCCRLYD